MEDLIATIVAAAAAILMLGAAILFSRKAIQAWRRASMGQERAGNIWLIIGPLLALICLALSARLAYAIF